MHKKYFSCFLLIGALSFMSDSLKATVNNEAIQKTLELQSSIAKKILEDVNKKGIAKVAQAVGQGEYTRNNELEVTVLHSDLTIAGTSGLGIPQSEVNVRLLKNPYGVEIGKIAENLVMGSPKKLVYNSRIKDQIVPARVLFLSSDKAVVIVKSPAPNAYIPEDHQEEVFLIKGQNENTRR